MTLQYNNIRYRISSVTPGGFIVHFCTIICILIVLLLQATLMMVRMVTETYGEE